MPSPFPGMDPYLEEPARWGGFHSRLINSISDQLADLVSPRFFVDIEERVYITTPTLVEPLYDVEIHDRFLEIRDSRNRQVVTTIEVLSPFNKASSTPGREAFMRKRETVMASPVHWIEIDLLRAGARPPEVASESDYYALLKRGNVSGRREVWYFGVRDALPTIAVPLLPGYDDVPLNFQAAFEDLYERAHYTEMLDYSDKVPAPRLNPPDRTWAAERTAAWRTERSAE
ncbi:MAG: DUF4058 family protein [Ardenticatenaceae bacterium]